MIVEAEKSHNLPSASQRPRKARGIVPVSKGLRTRNANSGSPSLTSVPAQQSGSEGELALLCIFVLFRPLTDWMMAFTLGRV